MRVSMDCKATVNIGEYSRGGKTRADNRAADHDMGCQEKYIPFGIVNEDTGALHMTFGSSVKTSDFIVDITRLTTASTIRSSVVGGSLSSIGTAPS